MRETRVLTDGLRSAIERSGYYPGLVSDAVRLRRSAQSQSRPTSSHHDAIFDPGMEVRRHMTVLLALTPDPGWCTRTPTSIRPRSPIAGPRAETSTEAIRFAKISSVALSRVVPDPAAYVPGVTMPSEVMLTIGWKRPFPTWKSSRPTAATRAVRLITATWARSRPDDFFAAGQPGPPTARTPCGQLLSFRAGAVRRHRDPGGS